MHLRSRITLLADNHAAPGLHALHGFSALVETAHGRLLFDTGPSAPALAENAHALGRRLDGLDAIVLSHGHYDHTGALAFILGLNPLARLFLHPAAVRPRYSRRHPGAAVRSIGMPRACIAAVDAHGAAVQWVHAPATVLPGMQCTGPIPRIHPPPATEPVFFLDPAARIPDPMADDQALALASPDGLIALLGCTHAGLANTLNALLALGQGSPLAAVIGGMHLAQADPGEHELAAGAILESGAPIVAPCHCTGDPALAHISRALHPHVFTTPASVGWTWEAV